MEEVPSLIEALCQGSAQEQRDAIETHFTLDAAFQHPLCRVPPLSWKLGALSSGGEVNSRLLIMAIYRWYRLLSPKIDFTIHSTCKSTKSPLLSVDAYEGYAARGVFLTLYLLAYNEDARVVYVDMSQIFAVWFIPFYRAHVHFLVVLDLVPGQPDTSYRREGLQYSDVTAERKPRYLISKQEDRYQLNDTVNFLMPGLGPLLCKAGQEFATLVCVMGVLVCDVLIRVLFGRKRVERTPLAYKPASRVE